MAAISSILAGIAIASSAASVVNSVRGSKADAPPAPPALPPPPARDTLGEEKAITRARARKFGGSRAGSIYSGPSGIDAPAQTQKPTLGGG